MDDFSYNCRISIFRQISPIQICKSFHFLNYHRECYLCIEKPPNQEKELINMVCVTVEGLWMVSDRIDDFRFFVKFHRSGPAKIFISELSQRMLVMHQKCS